MNNYFQLTENEQRLVLQQAAARYGLPAQAIEKDLWVSTILQIVFTLPFAERIIFKGGTSLSKVWHLIDRFFRRYRFGGRSLTFLILKVI